MKTTLSTLYEKLVLDRPVVTLIVVALVTAFFASFIPRVEVDVSADSLVLENDADLRYYRSIRARYSSDDYLFVTYTPDGELFAPETLSRIKELRDELAAVGRVESIISILDVPLLDNTEIGLSDMDAGIRTLLDDETDMERAKHELRESPLYKNRVVGSDGNTTAMQVNFRRDQHYIKLRDARDALREKELEQELTTEERRELERLVAEFRDYSSQLMAQEEANIARVRSILDNYRDNATIFLGGVPMIVADMMSFVRHDIRVFGVGVLAILALLLVVAFRRPRWVILPLLAATCTSLITVGFLGIAEWRVTVVSSNFLALLLIFSLSLTIHLIVRYRELHHRNQGATQRELVTETVRSKVIPSLYTALTTIVAFLSLAVSGIRPVIDFGWIMVIGLIVAFLITFTMFPAALMLLKPGKASRLRDITGHITAFFARLIDRRGAAVLGGAAIIAVLGVFGVSKLAVDNRFIDYFKDTTEIFQGMYLIDQKLGGTTPLDVIIDAPVDFVPDIPEGGEDEFVDDFGDDFGLETEAGITATSYWFNSYEMERINAIHDYLDGIDETGKVLSLSTTMGVLRKLDTTNLLDDFFLAVLHKSVPDDVKGSLFKPYLSEDGNQLRYEIRVYESDVALNRDDLLKQIRGELKEKFQLEDDQVHLSGMMVLFNNMLQSLYRSQILTLGAVFIVITIMFAFLFRSIKIAAIAITPNLLSAAVVLGLMGWLGIPLDLMTITIAAITVGIAVDDTIHYVHRYGEEIIKDGDYRLAVDRSHASIGRAMYYTTITITVGFSILVLSNFIPTIYFGMLTAFAMIAALVANLTVLPLLLEKFTPFKV